MKLFSYIRKSLIICGVIAVLCVVFAGCGKDASDNNVSTDSLNPDSSVVIDSTNGNEVLPGNTGVSDSTQSQPTATAGNKVTSELSATKNPDPSSTKAPENKTPSPTATPVAIVPGVVSFDKPSGFYSENRIIVTLEAAEGYDIYYTTDCSDPRTSATAVKYTKTCKFLDKSTDDGSSDKVIVLKAVAVKNGTKPTGKETVYTNTYIVNKSVETFSERYGNLGVFSISLDDELLFGSDGIYTNYTEHGRETERQATIEFFEAGGKCEISMDAGIRIYGGTSRGLAQKSLKVVARKEYSENGKFKYAFFPDNKDKDGNLIKKYDSFILRAGGNDSLLSGDRSTALRDSLAHKLAKSIDNISSQDARPVAVYLNGQYWGIYFLREDLDNDYVESHYDVPKENVTILAYGHENGQWFYKVDEGSDADIDDYRAALNYIASHDMTKSKYYNEACNLIDTDNFIKYLCINMYLNNRDWPQNNVRMWKYSGTYDVANQYTDGKWRFMLKDIDYSMGRYLSGNGAEDVTESAINHNVTVLTGGETEIAAALRSLLKNSAFKAEFKRIMNDIMTKYYSADTANAQIDTFVSLISDEMKYHMTCTWGGRGKIPLSKTQWTSNVNTLKKYFNRRGQYIQNLMNSYL